MSSSSSIPLSPVRAHRPPLDRRLVARLGALRLWLAASVGLGLVLTGCVVVQAVLLGEVLAAGLVLAGIALPLVARTVSRPVARPLATERARIGSHVIDTVEGSADVRCFGAAPQVLDHLDRLEQAQARTARRTTTVAGGDGGLSSLVAGVTTVGVITVGAQAVAAHQLSGVVVATLAFIALGSFDAVSTLPDAFDRLDQVLGSTRRVAGLGAVRPPVAEPERARPLPSGPGPLALRRASVTYPAGAVPALADVDLELSPGKKIAVVGSSGAGKTTLSMALLRYVELTGGTVRFDGIDCRQLAGDGVRSRIASAPQDPHLFATTVSANLRLARPDASDALDLPLVGLEDFDEIVVLAAGRVAERGDLGSLTRASGVLSALTVDTRWPGALWSEADVAHDTDRHAAEPSRAIACSPRGDLSRDDLARRSPGTARDGRPGCWSSP